jgi:ketose-bisphosphate aldolase
VQSRSEEIIMALVNFHELMADAQRRDYAVGYFESWNLESLLAVADAAEARRSPVILGFSGISLPDKRRVVHDYLGDYAAVGLEVCRRLTTPALLLFNESADMDWIRDAVDLGYQLVMYTEEGLALEEQTARVRQVVDMSHAKSVGVEGELATLAGIGGEISEPQVEGHLTDCDQAQQFVLETGVDALAVDIGQEHMHGRSYSHIDLSHLDRLHRAIDVPLVLHGASSIPTDEIEEAVHRGIRKVNVGSVLKQAYFENLRRSCQEVAEDYNPYSVIGSGLQSDILVAGRQAMQAEVERLMDVFGSSGKA